jgi:hypothetical protein
MEKQLEELKIDNKSPTKKHQQIRTMNPVEEAFDDSVSKVRNKNNRFIR